jgi:hypothetical protein
MYQIVIVPHDIQLSLPENKKTPGSSKEFA